MATEDLLYRLLDFCEENWSAFLARCEEAGYTKEEVEKAITAARA